MAEAPRHMDFFSEAVGGEPREQPHPDFVPNVVVMPIPHGDRWRGLWAIDDDGGHEEFDGDRREVIAWAKERCRYILMWNHDLQDLQPLDP